MIRAVDIARLAGLLEGEGTFGNRQSAKIWLGMTDADVVCWAARLLGVKKVSVVRRSLKNTRHKDYYHFYLHGRPAAEWMMTLYPMMGLRRRSQMSRAITRWKAQKGSPRDRQACPRGHPYDAVAKTGYRLCRKCLDSGAGAVVGPGVREEVVRHRANGESWEVIAGKVGFSATKAKRVWRSGNGVSEPAVSLI